MERDSAKAAITQTSEAEAAKSMSNWDTAIQATIDDIANKCKQEIEESDKIVVEELNRYAAASRLRAKGVATELADLMSKEYEGILSSQIANYDGQKNANNIAAAHAQSEVERLTTLLHSIRNGRDPGDDVTGLASTFPLLPLMNPNGSNAPLSPSSPSNVTKGKNSSPMTTASLPSNITSPRTRSLSPGTNVVSNRASSLRSPAYRSSSAEPSPRARANNLSNNSDNSSVNSLPNNSSSSLNTSGVGSSSSSLFPTDILSTLETRDAASLNVNVSRAKRELHQLMDRTLARWAKLGSTKGRTSDLVAFVRATQAVVAYGVEPETSPTNNNTSNHDNIIRKDHIVTTGVNIADSYLHEAERLSAKTDIEELRKRLLSLRASRQDLQNRSNSPSKADAVRTVASIDTAIKDAERAIQFATTNYQQKFHESP